MTADVMRAFVNDVGESGPVTCVGGRTAWDVGGAADPAAREVRAPVGIVEHEPAEMTVRVRAGTSVDVLQRELAVGGLRVLLPSPSPDATVGGVLAVGRSDVRRLAYGPLRDVLLEARYVSADGRLIKGGGPTVKNVSGFDLCRLLVGSLGTLGFLGEVVLRTRPVPDASRWHRGDEVDPFALVAELYRPAAILWDGAAAWVLLEGRAVDVREQASLLTRHGMVEVGGPPDLPPQVSSLTPSALRALDPSATGRFVAEIGVGTVHADVGAARAALPVEVVELNRRIKDRFDPRGRLNPGRDPLLGAGAEVAIRTGGGCRLCPTRSATGSDHRRARAERRADP